MVCFTTLAIRSFSPPIALVLRVTGCPLVPPLSNTHSLKLFRHRAELAGHPITEPGQVKLAQQICRRMHGHPLYVRLAAARMFYEPLPVILEQLSGESDDMRMQWRHGCGVDAAMGWRGAILVGLGVSL